MNAVGDTVPLEECDWLAAPMRQVREALSAGRLGHALLVHADPGCGGERFAYWVAQLRLCRGAPAPCGACLACRQVALRQHPDFLHVAPTEDSRQIRVDSIRALAAELALTSHAGGARVAVIAPAEAMNLTAANALLKTLEEPPPETLLVLVTSAPSRLPATVRSRCLRLRVTAPDLETTQRWLAAQGRAEAAAAVAVFGAAPFALLDADPGRVTAVYAETSRTLNDGLRDPVERAAVAERWARDDLPLRVACIETWLTSRIEAVATSPDLSAPDAHGTLRRLFARLDRARELKRELDLPTNKAVALEAWFHLAT
jgi:DNA polymerase-3 subunit delta'